ncbi:MAG: response regulator transcription factor [Saprospiraceae bacterium]|nr:response regulator transcription factor [Saprospiraceae bacterium]
MMRPVRILIVEDEMIIAAKISMHLEQSGYEVAGIIPRGEEAVIYCRENKPDILLLDINLKGLLDGVETAQVIQKEMDIPIIYLTGSTDDATFQRAKITRPFAFISKPYKKLDLQRAIDLTFSRILTEDSIAIKSESEQANSYILSDRIFVRHNNTMVKLFLKDVLYVEAERSYCRIFSKDSEYLLSIPLIELLEKLQPEDFTRIHRSFIINLKQIDEVAETHVVINKKAIPLGKSFKEDFLRRLRFI